MVSQWENEYNYRIALAGCLDALGVESRALADKSLTASSSLDSTSQAKDGRLHSNKVSNVQGFPDSRGGWIAQTSNVQQYIQVGHRNWKWRSRAY